jgi:hypothetical protein
MHGLVGDEIGQDLPIHTYSSGSFIAGRFYGEDGGHLVYWFTPLLVCWLLVDQLLLVREA